VLAGGGEAGQPVSKAMSATPSVQWIRFLLKIFLVVMRRILLRVRDVGDGV
jgi:hypothetical protein